MVPFSGLKKVHHKAYGIVCRQKLEFVCILQIHQQIADVVGSLNQPYQWIAHIFERFA
jgi:hypothetical protein